MERLVDWRLVVFVGLLMLTPYLNVERIKRNVKSDALDRCAEMEDEAACRQFVAEHHQSCWNRAARRRNNANHRGMLTRENFREGHYLDCLDQGPGAQAAEARQGSREAAKNREILRDPAAFQ